MSAPSLRMREEKQRLESQREGETGVKIHERNGWLRSFSFSIRRIFLGRKVIRTKYQPTTLEIPTAKLNMSKNKC